VQHIKLFEEYHDFNYDVTLKGTIQLYHYTRYDLGDVAVLSPEESVKTRMSWSMRDYKRSDVPRVFYYLDKDNTEKDIVSLSKNLYTGFVEGTDIIKVNNSIKAYQDNPKELLDNYPNVYNSIKNFVDKGGINHQLLLEDISKFFKGAYYKFGNGIEVVILFQSLEVYKIDYAS
jgi:hypothetical protein